jgi:Thiolase, C-terminal domain
VKRCETKQNSCIPERLIIKPKPQVNVNGGAIAFGHPLDESKHYFMYLKPFAYISFNIRCTGARQVVTGLHELARRDRKVNNAYSLSWQMLKFYSVIGPAYIHVCWYGNGRSKYLCQRVTGFFSYITVLLSEI